MCGYKPPSPDEDMRFPCGRLLLAVVAAILLSPGVRVVAQDQRPPSLTFEAGIEVIHLQVSVTEGRNFVTDLREKDFAIFEDGIHQETSLFIHERLPISLVLMLDTSASMTEKLPLARQAAVRFVKTLEPRDLAQVIQFNARVETLQGFTADKAALEAAINRTEASGSTALHNALYIALKELGRKKTRELRRRAIVLLSDGEDTASLVTDDQVLELARNSEVAIYAISLRPDRNIERMRKNFSQAAYLLTTLAQETGGRDFFPSSLSELDTVYDRVAEELRSLYSIGYVSSNKRRDGKWRRIVVRVPEREGLDVRHRIGYFGPAT
jgi:Ca-activated chloride channel family protein